MVDPESFDEGLPQAIPLTASTQPGPGGPAWLSGASKTTNSSASAPTPIVGAKHALLDNEAHVLPLGSEQNPEKQAQKLAEAPREQVAALVEKTKGDEREEKGEDAEGTVVEGIEDDKLWAMMRRFNVQVNHTLSPPTKLPPGEPDLRMSSLPDVPFNSDVLRSNGERIFATAGIWAIYSSREMMRLMSWDVQERRRTGCFCAAYFIAAYFSMVIPLIMGLLIALTTFPRSRKFLFPPIPPPAGVPASATDPTNKKGDESQLAGVGDPIEHRSKAEQIEQQAWEFTNTIQRFGMRVVIGGKGSGHQGNGEVGKKESKDEDENGADSEEREAVQDEIDGKELSEKQKRKLKAKLAREKRDAVVGNIAKGVQDGAGQAADMFECFANALSPPSYYPPNQARAKIAGALWVPILLIFAVVPAHWWAQIASFAFGAGFFGQPILIRAANKFVELVPDWRDLLDIRNSLLSQVPTNAQLVLYISRAAEAEYNPLPAPPAAPTATDTKNELSKTGIDDEAGDELVNEKTATGDDPDDEEKPSVTHKVAAKGTRKILSGLRLVAKKAATFRGDVQISDTRQKVGNKVDRILYQSRAKDDFTADSYPAKLDGTSGHLVISHYEGVTPTLTFEPLRHPETPAFTESIVDLVEVKKGGVFIARAVLGWAAAINIEGTSLELRFKSHIERKLDGIGKGEDPHEETHEGRLWEFSHVARRDQLFLRLISIGGQQWETL
ncbi:hypothetical protein P7C70_g5032, partial [Phenoliferia sp. Uapishka_3]